MMRSVFACFGLAFLLSATARAELPGERFDLRFWKLTLPLDANEDGKVDEIGVRALQE